MVKNIVFDIGNVLFGYLPSKEINKFGTNMNKLENANKLILKDSNWKKYLNGEIELKKLLKYYNHTYIGYDIEFSILLEKNFQKYIIYEIHKNTKILKTLTKKYNVYLLSNITKETHEYMKENYEFMKKVQGGVYSYIEHINKPERKIYEILLRRYNLIPTETIYIDDKIKNIEVASKLGFNSVKCDLDDNLEELLRKEGINIEYTGDNC